MLANKGRPKNNKKKGFRKKKSKLIPLWSINLSQNKRLRTPTCLEEKEKGKQRKNLIKMTGTITGKRKMNMANWLQRPRNRVNKSQFSTSRLKRSL